MDAHKKGSQHQETKSTDVVSEHQWNHFKILGNVNIVVSTRASDDGLSRFVMVSRQTRVDDQDASFDELSKPATDNTQIPQPHFISPNESMTSVFEEDTHSDITKYDFSSEEWMTQTLSSYSSNMNQAVSTSRSSTDSTQNTKTEVSSTLPVKANKRWRSPFAVALAALCIFVMASIGLASRHHAGANSVYVPGAGFSGFWFTLGRLRSIPDMATKDYYCYSAGCLGVVAVMSNFSIDEVSDMAIGVQAKWRTGEISIYQVVPKFLDVLLQRFQDDDDDDALLARNGTTDLFHNDVFPSSVRCALLSRLHIITSAQSKYYGLDHVIRTPQSADELREMLLQTTWIPFAIGNDLTHKGHLDGAFTAYRHPVCDQSLDLPPIFDLYLNALNVNLSKQKLEMLWNAGLQYIK